MSKKTEKKEIRPIEEMSPDEKLKYEIATELGLLDKVMESGWKSLSAKESGRIGGIMTKRKKQKVMEGQNKEP
ncbi:small, acid-soluble spore protein, alpha/beta type [Anaerocolumna xylanovorans]|uniref:Small, acid-soluble spore protein, alpha/beta type n=1 Tax=Anaerocolumna xylanovorans DSM 12503 TaxID=1121345 RepID=A0A1M7YH92_9FIRM|nr:small, acid-soluble spore protein, alpha/beta type [Anaerocolumna xylanovorans]SHO52005.1 Small, acid-soluble spore protein, alpha/beta type [Anaerocolumna xylanovorans DSM 12503]